MKMVDDRIDRRPHSTEELWEGDKSKGVIWLKEHEHDEDN